MLVSRFLNDNIDPFNLGVLLSRFQIKNDRIYGVRSYKSSKFVPDYEKSKVQVLDALNTLSVHPIWQSNQESVTKIKGTFVFILENDLHLDENAFYKKLLNLLIDNLSLYSSLTPYYDKEYRECIQEYKKRFLSGFFESRGSIDAQRNFLTLDYFFHSPLEFNKFYYLIDHFNIPSEALNFNFRELQPEYAQGIKRNAQFRIYLDWYLHHIGLFNPYKARIAEHVFKTTLIYDGIYYKLNYPPTTKYHGNGFTERAHFYLNNVYQQDLDKKRIKELREQLGLIQNSEEFKRDSKIINFYRLSTPNVCNACCDDYDIKERSFLSLPLYQITQRSDSYYTEIHHVISLGKNQELDVLENLAKLCPTCHRALKKGASAEGFQKRLIGKILKRNKGNLEFAQLRFETDDFLTLIDKIYESLK
ncbi:HNH endonuclease [Helicobacter pylori]|nr:HNH endonuclease [Helicobacter pylori]